MSRMKLYQRSRTLIVASLGITALGLSRTRGKSEIDPVRPECPHSWDTIPRPKATDSRTTIVVPDPLILPAGGNSVARTHTNVPEYNDCQKIILPDGKYGPLMAVFASYKLDSLVSVTKVIDRSGMETERATTAATVFAAAAVFNYSLDYTYTPLGIGPYYNCLFLWGSANNYHAKMVNVQERDQDCAGTANPDTLGGTTLTVIDRQAGPFNQASDYPAVARWDWDVENHVQYIGIKCGAAWCEVGPARRFFPSRPYVILGSGAPRTRANRNLAIKGWYDQQLLAFAGTSTTQPTVVRGTVIPDPELETYTVDSFTGQWKVVSHVSLLGSADPALAGIYKDYKVKFNFDTLPDGAPLKQMSEIAFCFGTFAQCKIPETPNASLAKSCKSSLASLKTPGAAARWWSRTTSNLDRKALYRCVTRRTHKMDIVATARWRWIALDETTWQDCIQGCCEVERGT